MDIHGSQFAYLYGYVYILYDLCFMMFYAMSVLLLSICLLCRDECSTPQSNLARRAAMEAKNAPAKPITSSEDDAPKKNLIRIGRPGYKVTKSRDLQSRQRSLTFEVDYPEAGENYLDHIA